jgi:hypothetical protein
MILYAMKNMNRYFHEVWPTDYELHEKMGVNVIKNIINDVTVYGDTDSVDGNSYVNCINNIKIKIKDLFDEYSLNNIKISNRGDEMIENDEIPDDAWETLNIFEENIITESIKEVVNV